MVNNYVLIYPQDFYPILLLSHYIVDSILNFGYSSCHIPYGSQSSNSFLFFRIRKQSPIVRAFSIVRGLLLTTTAFWSLHRIQICECGGHYAISHWIIFHFRRIKLISLKCRDSIW